MECTRDKYIVYASSDTYAPHTGISILSLLNNNKNIASNVLIYIIDSGISEENKKNISEVCNNFDCEVVFINANERLKELADKANLPIFRGSYSVYAQTFVELLLPEKVEKALYIDSDTIIVGSIKPLFELDLRNYAVAAVVGLAFYAKIHMGNAYDYELAKKRTYYNMGVILYNFDYWREHKICELIIKNAIVNPHFDIVSQTMLNAYLPESSILRLPIKYNYWGHIFPKSRIKKELSWGGFYSQSEINEAINNPIILHYKGVYAHPWVNGSVSSLRGEYIRYKKVSPWKDYPYEEMKDRLKKIEKGPFKTLRTYKYLISVKLPYNWMLVLYQSVKSCIMFLSVIYKKVLGSIPNRYKK